ncbi:hypothetical protein pCPXV0245 [Cowpox virus]|uniref:Uncharacterized protein n=1 Tax=Cowpox virus TaxID=10243 RepID=A0A212Q3P3_COWPX|nr:hypothetical protein pCPXV0245 [Cowpox virus]SNB53794.1 hypothetical protein pCPXV0245 [Cowpox virus]
MFAIKKLLMSAHPFVTDIYKSFCIINSNHFNFYFFPYKFIPIFIISIHIHLNTLRQDSWRVRIVKKINI